MLGIIRQKQKTFLVQIVFWAIIATFVGTIFLVWGKGDDAPAGDDFAAKINGQAISMTDYQRSYENIYRMYQNLYGEAFTPAIESSLNLRKVALDSLIDQVLLQQEAEKMKLKVGKQEIVEAIARIPAFQVNGVFSRDQYVQVLRAQRMTADQFEAMQKQELFVEKARQSLEGRAVATDADVDAEYAERNEKVNLALLRLDPALFAGRVKIDPVGLESFFADHKESFRLPETAKISYLIVDTKAFATGVELSETDLEKYYQRHLDRFEVPEQVRAAHLLIRVPQGATAEVQAEKRALIESLREKALQGEDFAALAKRHSEDPGSGVQGGDLGFFSRGTMVPSFESAAFALNVGAISGVVTTDFGYHLIRVSARQEAQLKPLAAVVEEVRVGAQEAKGRELALEKAMDLYNINRKGGSLDVIAKEFATPVQESSFFTFDQAVVANTALNKEVANAIFALQSGAIGRPTLLPQGLLFYALQEKRAAHIPELSEVRPAVEAAYRQSQAVDLAKSEGKLILAEVLVSKNLAAAARKRSLPVSETGLFTRSRSFFVPMVGAHEELSNTAFALTSAAPVPATTFEADGAVVVVQLKERQNADPAGLTEPVREEMRQAVVERKKQEILEQALKELREKAQINYAAAVAADQKG
ncbi:MAG: SurA N-terminal domain-containing protein [Desulfuromonadales bacterium]|nr:SurA N-terminal domain-containing protein [Desulfuromonadales bacterium]